MQLSNELLCLYSATIEQRDGSYVLEVPERELETGSVREGEVYRIAVVQTETAQAEESTARESSATRDAQQDRRTQGLPVEEGDIREVEIESTGDQGDGVAKIDRGYVVIVPGTEPGDVVTVEMQAVKQNFAIGEVIRGHRQDSSDTV